MNRTKSGSVEEAVDWMIVLQEEPLDSAREKAFQEWLSASHANERAWNDIQRTRRAVRAVATALPKGKGADESFSGGLANTQNAERLPGSALRRGKIMTAAGLMAACLLFFIAWPQIYVHFKADHLTSAGEFHEIQLADGSLVHLGADSAIAVDYRTGLRAVTLLAGEAYFDVRMDPHRPFKVRFGKAVTTVLGTAFEVSLSSRGASVAVEHGEVLVQYPASGQNRKVQQSQLSRGRGVRLDWNGLSEANAVAPESIASWRRGKLVVENWRISDVIDELKRHYRGQLVVGWQGGGHKRISGVYDLNDPVEAIRLVASTHGTQMYQLSPWLLLIPLL